MNQLCKLCDQPRKPRKDRPGKFYTLCAEHHAEYLREKNRESYARHQNRRQSKRREIYWADPEKARQAVRDYVATEHGKAKKTEYMQTYRRPWRAFVKDRCERCGFEAEDKRQLDVHHKDWNRANNDPSNLETLCPPCHRIVEKPMVLA